MLESPNPSEDGSQNKDIVASKRSSQLRFPFLSIDETPYMQRELWDQDPIKARTQALLADVTYPLTIDPLISLPARKNADRLRGLSYREEVVQQQLNENKQLLLNHFMNTGRMIELRDQAQALEQEYHNMKISPDSPLERQYLRKAIELHSQMQRYAREYCAYRSGRVSIKDITRPSSQIVDSIKNEISRAMRILRDLSDYTIGDPIKVSVNIPFKDPKKDTFWDEEEIQLNVRTDGKIDGLTLDEHFSYTAYCIGAHEIDMSQQEGIVLTHSQQTQLNHFFKKRPEEGNDDSGDSLPISFDDNEVLNHGEPIVFFLLALPTSIRKKIQSLGNAYSTDSVMVNGVKLNMRQHDYGEMQYVVNLDTRKLSNEEVWSIIETYIRAQQEYPRVLKHGKNS